MWKKNQVTKGQRFELTKNVTLNAKYQLLRCCDLQENMIPLKLGIFTYNSGFGFSPFKQQAALKTWFFCFTLNRARKVRKGLAASLYCLPGLHSICK